MMAHELKCLVCGKRFTSRWRSRQVTCGSDKCQRVRENQMSQQLREKRKPEIVAQKCANPACGKEFMPHVRGSQKYCSRRCFEAYRRKKRTANVQDRLCALSGCNIKFKPKGSHGRWKYCCNEHMRLGVREQSSNLRHATARHKWMPRTCAYFRCGKLFTPEGQPWNKYCSPLCRTRAAHKRAELPTAIRLAKKFGLGPDLPPDWRERPLDWVIIGKVLMSVQEMSNAGLAGRLESLEC